MKNEITCFEIVGYETGLNGKLRNFSSFIRATDPNEATNSALNTRYRLGSRDVKIARCIPLKTDSNTESLNGLR